MKYNPFKRGKKMTKQTQTPETENPTVETAESQAEQPTLESLQARIAELEGQLKDEQLRSLANEQNLRRRNAHRQRLPRNGIARPKRQL